MGPRKQGRSSNLPELSRLEMDVMNVVWTLAECSSSDVIREYRKTRSLAETTIRTVLANLRKKGFVDLVPTIERGFRFRAVVSRDNVARKTMHSLIAKLFEGSPRQAFQYLLKDEAMTDDDLDELRRMLDAHRRGEKP